MLDPVKKDERLSARKQDRLIQIVNKIISPGSVNISNYGESGVSFLGSSELDIRMFKLQEDMQFGADNTLAPHATTYEVLIKHGGDPDEYIAFRPEIEVYHPLSARDAAGNYVVQPAGYFTSGARVVAWFNEQSSRWELLVNDQSSTKVKKYYKAYTDWVAVDALYDRVQCNQCDFDGTNVRGSLVWVYLPITADCDPTVFTGNVIVASVGDEDVLTCDSCYGDGSKIGDIRQTTLDANIRPGWREATGIGPNWDCRDKFMVGRGSKNSVGAEGGFDDHGDGINDHLDHPRHIHEIVDESARAFDVIDGINANTDDFSSGPLTATTSTVDSHEHTFDVDATEYADKGDKTGTELTEDVSDSSSSSSSGDNDQIRSHSLTDNRPGYKTHIVIERYM